jgi:excisionase family DNA binding protein
MEILDGERHLSVREVAERLGKNEETIRRWLRSGKLRGRKIGTLHFVKEAEVERVLRLRAHPVALVKGLQTPLDAENG